MGRREITYKELFENYVDIEDTSVIELMQIEVQEGKATLDSTVWICEQLTSENMFDTEGSGPYPYIEDRTFELSDSQRVFTFGYVYLPAVLII